MNERALGLKPNHTPGARVSQTGSGGWHLEIPSGTEGHYRLAQLNDYTGLRRDNFEWMPPVRFSLRAKASEMDLPGTWGFGLWNDPFSFSLGFGGAARRFPALPNAAWFFFASPPNYLSLRDDLPAQGALAATFRSPLWPAQLLALSAPLMPLLLWSPGARLVRSLGRRVVRQDSVTVEADPTTWHSYSLVWQRGWVNFQVDGADVLETKVPPQGPLGLVIWVDNQYAALPPAGRLSYGALANPKPAWIDIEGLSVSA